MTDWLPGTAGAAARKVMNLNPLKYCFHGQHSRPRATFRTLPGVRNKRAVCAECYEKIIADRKQKKLAAAAAAR
jgi:hypothetical protein